MESLPAPFGWRTIRDGEGMHLTPLMLVLASVLIAGCAGHSANCTMGVGHSDCPPGTEGYKQMLQQQQDEKAIAAIDDVRCRSEGAEPGSEAYVKCRRSATAAHQLLEPSH